MPARILGTNLQEVEVLALVDMTGDGLDDASKGILSEASRLAEKLGGRWSAITIAGKEPVNLSELSPYGTPELTHVVATPEVFDSVELQGRLIAQVAAERGARLLLLPHNDLGSSLAPLLAAELNGALLTEVLSSKCQEGALELTRSILGDQVVESRCWDGSGHLVLTVNGRTLSSVVLPSIKPQVPKATAWSSIQLSTEGATRIVERIPPDPQTVDVSEAEVIVSAGLGCDAQTFAKVEELSRLLNISLGVTRPVYDLGFAGFERMIGQTGKTVAPRFYLALGISGSMHHLGGLKDSKRVVAVNLDSKAPIFPNADEGFVGDLREVLPLLIERVKSAVGGAS